MASPIPVTRSRSTISRMQWMTWASSALLILAVASFLVLMAPTKRDAEDALAQAQLLSWSTTSRRIPLPPWIHCPVGSSNCFVTEVKTLHQFCLLTDAHPHHSLSSTNAHSELHSPCMPISHVAGSQALTPQLSKYVCTPLRMSLPACSPPVRADQQNTSAFLHGAALRLTRGIKPCTETQLQQPRQ